MDRQVIALLKPTLQIQFGWTEIGYSNIVFAFQFAYAIGLLFVGKLVDRLGTRKGFSLAVFLWSLAAMAHAAGPVPYSSSRWRASAWDWASLEVSPLRSKR